MFVDSLKYIQDDTYTTFQWEMLYDGGFGIFYIIEFLFIVWISNALMKEVLRG